MQDLKELLLDELKDLYSAEKQIVKALPKMVRSAESDELKSAIQEHLETTKNQVTRLDEVFAQLDEKPKAKLCKGMEGLLKEAAEDVEENEAGTLRDLLMIGAAQRVEHYEIAAYGTARAIAEKLNLAEVLDLLNETLEEEEEADSKLSEIAESLYGEVDEGEEMSEEVEEEHETAGRHH